MKRSLLFFISLFLLSAFSFQRDQIRIVGSSTLYPFVSIAAEYFAKKTLNKTPVVEATGSGSGIKLFCGGDSMKYPDIVNSSRKIKESETGLCHKHNISNIEEITLGFDGIVISKVKEDSKRFQLTSSELYQALAKYIVRNNKIILNDNQFWSDINNELPKIKIEIYGPTHGSGTRDALTDIILVRKCINQEQIKNLYPNERERNIFCSLIREDGHYIESGENDNLIISKLINNHNAFGVISFNYLETNSDRVSAVKIDGVYPTKSSIINNEYPISRPLYMYINKDHLKFLPSLEAFIKAIRSDEYIGVNGILVRNGLIVSQSNQH